MVNKYKLYGYRWEPTRNIYWIFLENAGPKRLSRLKDFELWVDATRWAARLHTAAPDKSIEESNLLPCYDNDHFLLCAQRIERGLSALDSTQQQIVSSALNCYYEIVDYLTVLPRCLIHGEYFGKNIMIRPENSNDVIAVIDWETAALGPRAVDIVSITAGRWTSDQRNSMWRAYVEQYERETSQKIDLVEFHKELRCVALYRALWWLGYWLQGDEAHINRWMRELKTVMLEH